MHNAALQTLALICLLCSTTACNNEEQKDHTTQEKPTASVDSTYKNPVFEPVLADPTVLKDGAYFYAYGTEDNWGNEGGYHRVYGKLHLVQID